MADAPTGSSGVIRLDVSESGLNPAANNSTVNWAFYLIEASTNNSTWTGGPIGANVQWQNGVLWSGSFAFDWRGAGNQTTLIASGSFNPGRNPDGTGSVAMSGTIGDTGTSGAGGPTSVWNDYQLARLSVVPNAPTAPVATRVSDTQISLSWSQASPSNGQPQTNDIITSVNNGPWNLGSYNTINAANSTTLSAAPNQKLKYQVRGWNPYAGAGAWSADSNVVYTTPAAPTNATAAKDSSGNIVVNFTKNVAYSEHNHEVWHGTVTGGVTTWDGAVLATLASGVTTYTHNAPDPSMVHVYRVRAKAGTLFSGYATTGSVQLLAPPNAPTLPAMPSRSNKAAALTLTWTHNPVDTTPQRKYEVQTSIDGGTGWSSSGVITSAVSSRTIAANTYSADTTAMFRVRTWGSATSGGADGTGASLWSSISSTTFKTIPTTAITAPANGSTINTAAISVNVSFAQIELATFVKAQLELLQGATLLETLESTNQVGITFAYPGQNGVSYTVRARVQDSNGLWSNWATSTFSVTYLPPAPATPIISYIPETGYGQITLLIPDPIAGQSAAAFITITRTIDGETETVVENYPAAAEIGFLDTTPTIHGTNSYTITTISALGAQTVVTQDLVTEECRRAFLAKGPGFDNIVVFGGNLSVNESLSVASDTIQAAGRLKPIGLYGVETSVQLKVESFMYEGFGSTIDEVRDLLLVPGKACFRDASGRRVFGSVKGGVKYKKSTRGDLSFTMTETS